MNMVNQPKSTFVNFDLFETQCLTGKAGVRTIHKCNFRQSTAKEGYFQIQNRRYLGNKYKLLGFIEDIVLKKCGPIESLCDIFAGTGVVGEWFNSAETRVISNDLLYSNYVGLATFLGGSDILRDSLAAKIGYLNNLPNSKANYFSRHFGGTYFTEENAKKIGLIREEIERIAQDNGEHHALICSLLYAADKVANTVGHYDAFRKQLDMLKPVKLLVPDMDCQQNVRNKIYNEDANTLIRKISCDVLYIDPPYNSRQYSDAYHLLENLAVWGKPEVLGICKKMNRAHIKSDYCLKSAGGALADLVRHANCRHILLSYNNTSDSKDGRSNARISDDEIFQILTEKGRVETFETNYPSFTTGKSATFGNAERVFYCKVRG